MSRDIQNAKSFTIMTGESVDVANEAVSNLCPLNRWRFLNSWRFHPWQNTKADSIAEVVLDVIH